MTAWVASYWWLVWALAATAGLVAYAKVSLRSLLWTLLGRAGAAVVFMSPVALAASANQFVATNPLGVARALSTATRLPNGKVLVVGGYNGGDLSSAELYDPAAAAFAATGSLAVARADATATLLPNGNVLIAGGFGLAGALASAELYD